MRHRRSHSPEDREDQKAKSERACQDDAIAQTEKNTVSVVMAVARDTGLIVGQAVSQERSLETFQALADTLPPAQHNASDGLAFYAELIWPEDGQHLLAVGKTDTQTIESLNANLRTYLARLARNSRCFSRSVAASGRQCGSLSTTTTDASNSLSLTLPIVDAYHSSFSKIRG